MTDQCNIRLFKGWLLKGIIALFEAKKCWQKTSKLKGMCKKSLLEFSLNKYHQVKRLIFSGLYSSKERDKNMILDHSPVSI